MSERVDVEGLRALWNAADAGGADEESAFDEAMYAAAPSLLAEVERLRAENEGRPRDTRRAVDKARKEALASAQRARNWAHNSSDIEYMRTVAVSLKTENYQLREELRGARLQQATGQERRDAPLAGALDHRKPAECADTSMEGRSADSAVSMREHEPQAEGSVPGVLEAGQASAEGCEVEAELRRRGVEIVPAGRILRECPRCGYTPAALAAQEPR